MLIMYKWQFLMLNIESRVVAVDNLSILSCTVFKVLDKLSADSEAFLPSSVIIPNECSAADPNSITTEATVPHSPIKFNTLPAACVRYVLISEALCCIPPIRA